MEFNTNWKFCLEDNDTAHLLDYDDSSYKIVQLPHDYSMAQPYNKEEGDGCTGYKIGGIGWYRKKFMATEEMLNKKVFICFDGIYNRSDIYINEQFVAFHPYGYAPLLLDLTEYIKEGENLIAVRVDHTRHADSRWYTGSGIYRNVDLHVLPKVYIPVWGMKVHTVDVSSKQANICINLNIINETVTENLSVETSLYTSEGILVDQVSQVVEVDSKCCINQVVTVKNPKLWDIYQGNLYTVKTKIIISGTCIQEKSEQLGIRDFYFDADKGFFINGRNELIKGVCLHHDAGAVGAAVPKDVWRRRLQTLIDGGCNAIRTAHNPVSKDFLDLCDEIGLLVQEEFYDEWDFPKDKRYNMKEQKVDYITRGHHEFFNEYAQQDLQAVVHRDYNHPSIIQWSIGNEIEWTYPKYVMATGYFDANANGNYFWEEPPYSVEEIRSRISKLRKEKFEVGKTAKKLADWTREIDITRPVIANCILPSASYESGYTDALDMVGFSYRQVVYDRCHNNYPNKAIMGTENLGQWHEWKHIEEKEYISGMFIWTGIDYLGESGHVDVWPRKANCAGLLDVAGFKKGSYHMFKALWTSTPCIHMMTQTLQRSLYNLTAENELVEKEGCNWRGRYWVWQDMNNHYNYEGQKHIVVEVYSNCDSVTLYLNDDAVATKSIKDFEDRIYKWCIPYTKGTLKAVGHSEMGDVETILKTASKPTQIKLVADKGFIQRSKDSVVHIEAILCDENGYEVAHTDEEIQFIVEGDYRLYGVDNGSPDFVGDHMDMKITTNKGKALMILGSHGAADIHVHAMLHGKKSNDIYVQVEQ